MATYVVKEGDHLSSIAADSGFRDFRTIWNDGNNAALKSKRENPHVLMPGDQLFIPDWQNKIHPAATTKVHTFQTKVEKLKLKLVVENMYGDPVKNTPCELVVEGKVFRVTTDDSGQASADIPRKSHVGKLVILEEEIPLEIGNLDPVDQPSGQQGRLMNLGYYRGTMDSSDANELKSAIEEFQCDQGLLPVSGVCDARTQVKLKEIHGC